MSDLAIKRGDSAEYDLEFTKKSDGTPWSLVGAGVKIWFTVKRQVTDPDNAALFQKTTPTDIEITDAPNGKAKLRIAAADTNALADAYHHFHWDCQVKGADGRLWTPLSGRLTVHPDITRSAS